jgi:uncharacterized protein YecE (DUF72 family)
MDPAEWLGYYSARFDTVEINNTFYGLPEEETFANWRETTPEDFLFVLKFSRYGTHVKHLKDPQGPIDTFLERATMLGHKLGPILVQLRPNWHVNVQRLAGFLQAAPDDCRWALEFRDPTWLCDEVFELLREHKAALCVHDLIDDHPRVATADWVYLRFHGAGNGGCYDYHQLSGAARRMRNHVDEGREVFAYFNNDAHGYAIENARALRRYLQGH